jgi:hypothetical protein
MRNVLRTVVLVALALAVGAQAFAGDKVQVTPRVTKEVVAINLMAGLASNNKGVRESSAFMLGEEKVTRAVVPLMKMLKDSEEESSRIVAALALCRMGEPRGAYAVRMAAKFDQSQRVRVLCAWFYEQYVQAGTFAFAPVEQKPAVEYGER